MLLVFDEIKHPLRYIFKNSLKESVFPGISKIAKIAPTFKTGK